MAYGRGRIKASAARKPGLVGSEADRVGTMVSELSVLRTVAGFSSVASVDRLLEKDGTLGSRDGGDWVVVSGLEGRTTSSNEKIDKSSPFH